MPTKDELHGAFTAWTLAIKDKLFDPDSVLTETIRQSANDYGIITTTREALDFVEEWYNWGAITDYINSLK